MNQLLLLGEIDVNCYFIEYDGKCYIVDPGYEKDKVIQYVQQRELEVLGILLTHAHIDHIGAIDAFDVPVYLHEREIEIIEDDEKNGFGFYGRRKPYDLSTINLVPINEDMTLPIGDREIKVWFTPGHTVGCVCYQFGNDMYTGDTLFKETVGKWTFPTGDLAVLQKSVVDFIDSQDEAIRIHPAHGPSSTIGYEKEHNHFYKEWKKDRIK